MTQINWNELEANPNNGQQWSALASDTSGGIVFAANQLPEASSIIYKSLDAGLTWASSASSTSGFRKISSSDDASKVVAITSSNAYYNVGAGWVKNTVLVPHTFRDIAISNTSQSGAGITQYLWTATLDGLFWNDDPSNYSSVSETKPRAGLSDSWNSLALSDGFYSPQYILVGGYNLGIYKSANNSLVWTDITPIAGSQVWTVGMSRDNSLYYAVTAEATPRFYKSINQGAAWVQKTTGATTAIQDMFISTDGQKIILIQQKSALLSQDAGETWSSVTLSFTDHINLAISVSGSSDFTRLFIGTTNGSVYYSDDLGVSWISLDIVPTSSYSFNWAAVASDYNNTSIIAVVNSSDTTTNINNNFVYYSNDSGVTWHQSRPAGTPGTATPWKDVSIDPAGTVSAAISSPGRVYVSTDSSANFTEHAVSQSVDKVWRNSSRIYNNIFFVSEFGGRLYKVHTDSTLYEEVMPAGNADKDWRYIEFAEDGLHVVAVVSNGRSYLSSDSGATWSEIQPTGNANGDWNVCSISSTGKYILLGKQAGRIYLSKDTGVTWAEVQPSGNINVTWENCFIDDSGETMLVSGFYLSGGSPIYVKLYSKNFGTTWESLSSGVGTEQLNKLTANKNGLRILSAGTTTLYQGDVVNFKNASFIGDMII